MPITVSGTSIVFNDSTTQTTAFTGAGGVTSLNGQTGAITNTNTNVIGSYISAGLTNSGATITYGSTWSGSNLRQSTASGGGIASTGFDRLDSFNLTNPSVSGTWRSMGRASNGIDGGEGYTIGTNLFVRIS